MVDKTKTIKSATDAELEELIKRLRKERELQSLIEELKRKTIDGYAPYDYSQGISTEKPIESMYHFGILGMHWGKRKAKDTSNTVRKTSEDNDIKSLIKSKKLPEMSNAEIKKINERIQLEKQFKELTKTSMSPGKKFVVDLLANQAKEFATDYVRKQITKLAARGT